MIYKGLFTALLFSTASVCYAMDGEGTKENPYIVSSAADLNELSDMVNGLNDKTQPEEKIYVLQTADIDLASQPFRPIGSNGYYYLEEIIKEDSYWSHHYWGGKFWGDYDGQGFKIKGLKVYHNERNVILKLYEEHNTVSYGNSGLFGNISSSTIKNVVLEDPIILGEDHIGALVGNSINSTIKNCQVKNGIVKNSTSEDNVLSDISYMGGVCGYGAETTIDSCLFEGSVVCSETQSNNSVGGIIGELNNKSSISNCTTYGEVSNITQHARYCETGGICGIAEANTKYCVNYSSVTSSSCTGGINGVSDWGGKVIGCANYGNVTSIDNGNATGGIVGSTNCDYDDQVRYSANYGTVKGINYVGGISGHASCLSCMNFGTVEGVENVGGIIAKGTAYGCVNSSRVTGEINVGAVWGIYESISNHHGEKDVNCYNTDSCQYASALPENDNYPLTCKPLTTRQMIGTNAFSNMATMTIKADYYLVEDGDKDKVYYPHLVELKNITEPYGIPAKIEFDANGFCDQYNMCERPTLKGDTYEIANAGQLYWFMNKVNQSDSNFYYNAKLIADIVVNKNLFNENGELTADSLSLRKWNPIGDAYTSAEAYHKGKIGTFCGMFDGQGHSIEGLYFNDSIVFRNESVKCGAGLFGYIKDATIKNVNLVNCYFKTFDKVGGIVCHAENSRIDSCSFSGIIHTHGDLAAGILGQFIDYSNEGKSKKSVTNCTNYAKIIQDTDFYPYQNSVWVSGICGRADTLINCNNYGNIIGSTGVNAGIVASCKNGYIDNCNNYADSITGGGASGICGNLTDGTIINCTNRSNLYGIDSWQNTSGGINAANSGSSVIKYCHNSGNYQAKQGNYNGGIVGYGHADITNCDNSGSITVEKGYMAGGIVGETNGNIYSCYNMGDISIKEECWSAGGIAGIANHSISKCINHGNIKGDRFTGGICGKFGGSADVIEYCANHGDAKGKFSCGGIVADAASGTIRYSYNRGDIYAGERAGGLAAYAEELQMKDCYNTGSVNGDNKVAGIAGYLYLKGSISSCYNIGKIPAGTSKKRFYGIAGESDSNTNYSCVNTYSNRDSCTYNFATYDSISNIDSLKTEYMIDDEAMSHMNGLDFENVWYMAPSENGKHYFPHLIAFKEITEAPYTYLGALSATENPIDTKNNIYSIKEQILFECDKETFVVVYDAMGRIVKQTRCQSGINDLGSYSKGIYLVNGTKIVIK